MNSRAFKQKSVYPRGEVVGCHRVSPHGSCPVVQEKLMGSANEALIEVDGCPCTALLDTGSTVSTISETFYKENLKDSML